MEVAVLWFLTMFALGSELNEKEQAIEEMRVEQGYLQDDIDHLTARIETHNNALIKVATSTASNHANIEYDRRELNSRIEAVIEKIIIEDLDKK
jgi:septal ring factor EnvC (AmiA/AmiB activator)